MAKLSLGVALASAIIAASAASIAVAGESHGYPQVTSTPFADGGDWSSESGWSSERTRYVQDGYVEDGHAVSRSAQGYADAHQRPGCPCDTHARQGYAVGGYARGDHQGRHEDGWREEAGRGYDGRAGDGYAEDRRWRDGYAAGGYAQEGYARDRYAQEGYARDGYAARGRSYGDDAEGLREQDGYAVDHAYGYRAWRRDELPALAVEDEGVGYIPLSFFADTGGVGPYPSGFDYGGGGGGYVYEGGGAFAGARASASVSASVSASIAFRGGFRGGFHGHGGPPSHGGGHGGCGCK